MELQKLTLDEIISLKDSIKRRFESNDSYQCERKATNFVLDYLKQRVSEPELLSDTEFIAGEMISNGILYGNNLDPLKIIEIYCGFQRDNFYFAIKDEGKGFNMNNPPEHGDGVYSGIGISESKKRAELYNFNDNVAYVCLNLKRKPLKKDHL